MKVEELITRAAELKLAGVVITDHHYQWPQAELDSLTRRLSPNGPVVLAGFEVTTSVPRVGGHAGDLLIYGMEPDAVLRIWTPYDEACAAARKQDALIISAHPFREGIGAGDRVFEMDIDGIEVYNQNHSQLSVMRAKAAVKKAGFLGVAGSDAHRTAQMAQFITVFRRPVRTMEDFIHEIRARRYWMQSNRPDIR